MQGLEVENTRGDWGETNDGRDEETDLDETDRNWMLNDMAEDGNVKF